MKSKFSIPALVLGLLLCGCTLIARAQAPAASPTPSEEQQKRLQKEAEQKALSLLDEILKDSQSFKLPENRLRLRAIAAALLWKYDSQRARLIFKETIAGVIGLMKSADDEADDAYSLQSLALLRSEIVQLLGPHDARMARDFVRATRLPGSQQPDADTGIEDDVQLEFSLATQAVETDPKQALEIAEENLSRGYSNELINTLTSLIEKDRKAATKLTGEIVAKLRSENLMTNQQAAGIAYSLLQLVFPTQAQSSSDKPANGAGATPEPLLDEQGMHDLLEMNITLALNSPSYLGRLQTLEALMPQVQKYAPARVAELRRKMAQGSRGDDDGDEEGQAANAEGQDWEKYRILIEKGSTDDLLAEAAKAPPAIKSYLYQAAAAQLIEKGELERAKDIINNRIASPAERKQLLEMLDQQASVSAAEQGKMEQVRKSLANMRTNDQRALALAQIAVTLAAKGEQKMARQLLIEAQTLVNYRARNLAQLKAQFTVALAFIKVEPERSLAILEPMVDQLNELLAAAITLGGFMLDEELMRDDEIRLELITSIFPLFSHAYMPYLYALASFDFDRARALADRFQRDEARMVARLLLVQSVLGDRPATESDSQQLRLTSLYSHQRRSRR